MSLLGFSLFKLALSPSPISLCLTRNAKVSARLSSSPSPPFNCSAITSSRTALLLGCLVFSIF
ncbi:hypothetical protein S83_036899 [Arachis hypogaea]